MEAVFSLPAEKKPSNSCRCGVRSKIQFENCLDLFLYSLTCAMCFLFVVRDAGALGGTLFA